MLFLLLLNAIMAYCQKNSNTDGIINDSMPLEGPPQPPPETTIYRQQNGLVSDADRLGISAGNRPYDGRFGQGFPTNPLQYDYVNQFGNLFSGGGIQGTGGGVISDPYGNLNNLGRNSFSNSYINQAQVVGSQFYCFHCSSPRTQARPEILAAMDQLFQLRFTQYPMDAVNEFCEQPIEWQKIRRQVCRHPYCYAIKFGDKSKGDLVLAVRGCAENFMAINPAQLSTQMGSAGTCRELPSNHHLPVRECVCRQPFCDDYSRGAVAHLKISVTLVFTMLFALLFR